MAITDAMHWTAAVWELGERLTHHTKNGELLQGLKWIPTNRARAETMDTLPSLQFRSVSFTQAIFPGARSTETSDMSKLNVVVSDTLVVRLELTSDVDDLWVRRQPGNSQQKKGHMEWMALVRDAIETDTEGVVDCSLGGSLCRPIMFAGMEPEGGSLGMTTVIEVTLPLMPNCRGALRKLFAPHVVGG